MEEIRCIFCPLAGDSVAIVENGYTARRCTSCGLIYVSPRPTADAIRNLYGHDQAHIPAAWHIATERLKRRNARHLLRLIRRHRRRGALLEIGAGAGYFLDEARRAGFEPHGIELNPVQARFIRERLQVPCEESPLAAGSFGGRRFDLIVQADVLSHLPDPIGELKAMEGALAADGLLVLETGNYADVDRRHYALIGTFQLPDHLFFFGAESLGRLLDAAGFSVLEERRYSTVPQLIALRAARALRRRGGGRGGPGRGPAAPAPPGTGSPLARLARPAYQDLLHVLRYGAGALAPRRGRPQTIILIARRLYAGARPEASPAPPPP